MPAQQSCPRRRCCQLALCRGATPWRRPAASHPRRSFAGLPGVQELLQQFDLDLDFPAGRLRLYRPGDGMAAAAAAGLVEVPAAVLNETGAAACSPQPTAAQLLRFQQGPLAGQPLCAGRRGTRLLHVTIAPCRDPGMRLPRVVARP